MAKAYVERLAALIGPLVSGRFKGKKVEVKHFFSGAAVYANGKICISLTPVGLALKLPERSRTILLKRKGTKPLRYFPNGPIKKKYVVLPQTMVKDRRTLPQGDTHYVAECVEVAVVTQGKTLDETIKNLQEAVELHLQGEDLAELGLVPSPTLLVTMELEPVHA